MMPIRLHALAGTMAWAALAITVSVSAPAQAQTYDPNYPVCLQVYQGMVDFYFDCSYTSMAQCAASASGRSAACVVNPYYAKPHAKPAPRRKRSHQH
jgi:Tfp pilus assembly protein PilV